MLNWRIFLTKFMVVFTICFLGLVAYLKDLRKAD